VTLDGAHIFCTEEQVQDEIASCVAQARYLYELFGLTASAEFATRPDNKVGTDEQWDRNEAAIEEALRLNDIPYTIAPGEGAFYGPKIDLFMDDALGRKWQMGTIQLDSQMPSRFGLTYVGADNAEHELYVVHRALYGSFERFLGILIEHFAGDFPYWLAPVQVVVVPIGEKHHAYANEVGVKLKAVGVRVHVDVRNEKMNAKIREHAMQKVPFMLVVGDKEAEAGKVNVRTRGKEKTEDMGTEEFGERVRGLILRRIPGL